MTEKKDLTSLVELSNVEAPQDPNAGGLATGEVFATDTIPHPEAISFETLDEIALAPPIEADAPLDPLPIDPAPLAAAEPIAAAPVDTTTPVINAPPAGSVHTHLQEEAPQTKQGFEELREFGEKIAIGTPHIEASPAFSLMVTSRSGFFDDKAVKAIEDALTSEDFGVRVEDVRVQFSSGKLLVPRISEFAAITLAQKLRDAVDNIEIGPAEDIYQSETLLEDAEPETIFLNTENFAQHREEIRDLAAEPKSVEELFSTNMSEVSNYRVTRILSTVMATEILDAHIAKNPESKEFERSTERLTRELLERAFRLNAHGILGINFTLKPVDGNPTKVYRLMGTGTAVRAKRTTT